MKKHTVSSKPSLRASINPTDISNMRSGPMGKGNRVPPRVKAPAKPLTIAEQLAAMIAAQDQDRGRLADSLRTSLVSFRD
mgnify:CR=1